MPNIHSYKGQPWLCMCVYMWEYIQKQCFIELQNWSKYKIIHNTSSCAIRKKDFHGNPFFNLITSMSTKLSKN